MIKPRIAFTHRGGDDWSIFYYNLNHLSYDALTMELITLAKAAGFNIV